MSRLSVNGHLVDKVELCIFDKDGTLIDIHRYWSCMIRYRAEHLVDLYVPEIHKNIALDNLMDAMGIDLTTGKIKEDGPVGIMPRPFIIKTALESINKYNFNVTEKNVRDAFDKVDEYSKSRLKEIIHILPGVVSLLEELKTFGVFIAVATTDITERAEMAMDTISLLDYFDIIAGADKVTHSKPSSDLVEYITSHLGVNPAHTVVIGDSEPDQFMAENAGVQFIGVGTGLKKSEFPGETGLYIDTLESLHVVKS